MQKVGYIIYKYKLLYDGFCCFKIFDNVNKNKHNKILNTMQYRV